MASIVVSRQMPSGNLCVGHYLVDCYCLGLKDTMFLFNLSEYQYEEHLEKVIAQYDLVKCDYNYAHNIIYGGIAYAEDLDFDPHKDFRDTQFLLDEDDESIPLIEVEFGLNGKPTVAIHEYHKGMAVANHLRKKVGEGNFSILFIGDMEGDDMEDDFEEEDMQEEMSAKDLERKLATVLEDAKNWDVEDIDDFLDGQKGISRLELHTVFSATYYTAHPELPEDAYERGQAIAEELNITYEPLEEDNKTEEEKALHQRLFLLSHDYPKAAIPELKRVIVQHPDVPQFYNFLCAAYVRLNMFKELRQLACDTYKKFPKYLFGIATYGNILLEDGQLDKVTNLLDHKYHLPELYPERKVFHVDEVVGFHTLLVRYFIMLEDIYQADLHLEIVLHVAPNHPSVLASLQISNKWKFMDAMEDQTYDQEMEA